MDIPHGSPANPNANAFVSKASTILLHPRNIQIQVKDS